MRQVVLAAILLITSAVVPSAAQWLKHPDPRIPRTADGKPDLSGLWQPGAVLIGDISRGMKDKQPVPFQPWAEKLYNERRASESKDDPTADCIVGGVPRSDLIVHMGSR